MIDLSEMIPRGTVKFIPQKIDPAFVDALVTLKNECNKEKIEFNEIRFYQGGFSITFKNMPGDVVCHEHSYGHNFSMWESYGMPWDLDDVSVHSSETLVLLIKEYLAGGDWESVAAKE